MHQTFSQRSAGLTRLTRVVWLTSRVYHSWLVWCVESVWCWWCLWAGGRFGSVGVQQRDDRNFRWWKRFSQAWSKNQEEAVRERERWRESVKWWEEEDRSAFRPYNTINTTVSTVYHTSTLINTQKITKTHSLLFKIITTEEHRTHLFFSYVDVSCIRTTNCKEVNTVCEYTINQQTTIIRLRKYRTHFTCSIHVIHNMSRFSLPVMSPSATQSSNILESSCVWRYALHRPRWKSALP